MDRYSWLIMTTKQRFCIFNRFYHGEKSDPNSNGIGLSLAKQIINSQNGVISCESEEGKGTIFEIKIYKSATV